MAGPRMLAALILALGVSAALADQDGTRRFRFLLLNSSGKCESAEYEFQIIADSLVASRQLALGPGGSILLASKAGRLLLVDEGFSRSLEGSLPSGSWPEALASDGADWWILHRQGREILRLGRRGELLGVLRPPEGFWSGMDMSASGRIWLADSEGERFVALGRGGQLLLDWRPAGRVPGYSGASPLWCAEVGGGLVLLSGRRVFLLNAAGNLEHSWLLPETVRPRGLLSLGAGQVLVFGEEQSLLDIAYRRDQGLRLLGGDGKTLFGSRIPQAIAP